MAKTTKPAPQPEPELRAHAFVWLAFALGLIMLPHIPQLPVWLTMLFVLAATIRCWGMQRRWPSPRRWQLIVLTVAAGAGVLYGYGTLFGRDAGVALLAAMTALKMLEARSLRDGMVLCFLGYFLVMANLLYTQSLSMAFYLLLTLSVLIATQTAVQQQHQGLSKAAPLRLATRMLLQSFPLMLILFILFPRIPGPLWGLPKDAYSGFTGLNDEMSPGTISQLILSDEVAFRVRFNDPVPPADQLYWRGPVLWRYDGLTWKGLIEVPRKRLPYRPVGEGIDYTVILEPHGQRWLFALDVPAQFPAGSGITDSLNLVRPKRVNEVLRYEMRSYPSYHLDTRSRWGDFFGTRLPRQGNPRTQALGAELQARYTDPQQRVSAALRLFREQPFYYTLTPPLLGADSVDEFLFDTRRGFCEHYASSFVFLMRAAGVPARVVTGYQGGERNDLGDYFIVRQSDAHAWAEVWLEGRAWVRIDPTAAVAPQRVERGLYAAVDPADLPFLARRDSPWLRQLALSWDSVNNAWNEWVLAYGPERQREFLSNLGFGTVRWPQMTVIMIIALAVAVLIMGGLYTLRQRQAIDPVAHAYRRFCAKLAHRGLARHTHEGPLDFCERIAGQRPDLAERVRLIGALYAALRYGRAPGPDAVRRLRRLIDNFSA